MIFPFGGMRLYVRAVSIEGHPSEDTVTQTIVLQDRLQPTPPPMDELYWRSRVVLGRVVKNNHEDPTQSGRVQVEFDWEKLDPTSKGANRAWLPVVTPYAAVAGGRGRLPLPARSGRACTGAVFGRLGQSGRCRRRSARRPVHRVSLRPP